MNKLSKFLDSVYDRWSKCKRPILIVFLLTIAYVFYRDHNFVELLRKYIVAPYLSSFNPSKLFNVLVLTATILLLILKLHRSLKNKPIPSLEINISLATILVILTIERLKPTFEFKYVEIIPGLTYFDFVLLVTLCILLISLMPYIHFWFSKNEARGKSSFTKDFTGDSKECPEDKLGREKFAEEIGKQILNLDPEKGSFCIGIEGSWGSGKSFMLNLIERHITDKAIAINFNPWKGNETKNIYRDFFYTLSETLGKFNKSIDTRLIRYYTVLSDDNSGSIWYYLKSLIFNTQSLKGISEKINERLKCLKKTCCNFY